MFRVAGVPEDGAGQLAVAKAAHVVGVAVDTVPATHAGGVAVPSWCDVKAIRPAAQRARADIFAPTSYQVAEGLGPFHRRPLGEPGAHHRADPCWSSRRRW